MSVKVNLGCGNKKREGCVNVDVCCDPDVRWDLSRFPWPFEDGSVILKDDGVFHFKVPYFKSPAFP